MPDPSTEATRVVTIVTSDLKGSTSLGEQLDPESLREVLSRYFDEMGAVLESHGGVIEKIIGDAIVAVFGLPEARPDDALRAVRAAAETQRTLAALNDQLDRQWAVRLTNRTGIATGELVVREATAGEHILTGAVLPLATSMEAGAPADEVLIADSTLALVADDVVVEQAGDVQVKGEMRSVPAHRLITVTSPAEPADGSLREDPDSGGGPGRPGSGSRTDTRKTVTIVFADIRATELDGRPLPPERLRDAMAACFDAARTALEAHGGTVEKYIGDAVMAVFGLPVRHEDDALRAVRAALDMQRGLGAVADAQAADQVLIRMAFGVNTGEVVAGDASLGQRLVTGDAVNVAARLEQTAPERGVVLGGLTYRLVRDAVEAVAEEPLTLKGKAEPVAAYRLLGLATTRGADRTPVRPMVGRETELGQLLDALRESITDGAPRMATLIGDAGVGKTRLTEEFLARASAEATVIRGRCLPYGDGITFWPVVELVREAADIGGDDPPDVARRRIETLIADEEIAARVASAIGLPGPSFPVGELFWGIRRFLETLAAERPVVVLFDDIHWAETTLLELITHLVSVSHDAPLMILCGSRTELLERHPDWATSPGERRIVLAPLSESDAGRIAEGLLGGVGLGDTVRDRIVRAAEGNPLFIEQVLSMLVENGSLREVDGRWEAAADLSRLTIPPTIQALLAARIDRLNAAERAVLDPASIIGQVFARAALATLVGDDLRTRLPAHLRALTTKQLIRPDAGDKTAHQFGHILIRDTTYEGLLKRTRAELHERFVAWADEANRASGRAAEFEEILGYHLEQAYGYRRQLGPLDDHGADLGVRAAERLASAGRRAFERGDLPAATNLLARAVDLLDDGHARRPGLQLLLGLARVETGDYDGALEVLDAAARAAADLGDTAILTRARLQTLLVAYLTGTLPVDASPEADVRAGIAALEPLGDHDGLADAWGFIGNLRLADNRWEDASAALSEVIRHAQLAGDQVTVGRMGAYQAIAALNGPTPVDEVIAIGTERIARAGGNRKTEALILRVLAHARAMRGEFAQARDEYRRAREILDELGQTFQAALTSIDSGAVEMLAGDPIAAEAEYRRDYETLQRLGERNYIATIAAYLADALEAQGRSDEATELAAFSAAVAEPDDVVTQFLWRQVSAKLAAREGDADRALMLANEAVQLTLGSDDVIAQAEALADLATVLDALGRTDASPAPRRDAIERFERKGDLVSAGRHRAG